jgi:phage tail-like protein
MSLVLAPLTSLASAAAPPSVVAALGYRDGWLVGALPVVMQEDDLMRRFVTIFEEIASSVRYAVEKSDDVADLAVAPLPMVRYLGEWVQAPAMHAGLPASLQRDIVRACGATLPERGTASALTTLLEAITGSPVTVHDSGGVFAEGQAPIGPSMVVVRVAGTGHLSESELRSVIRAEVPAHITVEVVFVQPDVVPQSTNAEDRR